MKRLLVALVLFVALCVPVLAEEPVAWIDWGPQAERHGDYVSVPGMEGTLHVIGKCNSVEIYITAERMEFHKDFDLLAACHWAHPVTRYTDYIMAYRSLDGFYMVCLRARCSARLYHWQQRVFVRGG